MIHQGDEPVPGYRLEGFLGRGAFGEVWQSSAPGGTRVALKFINISGKNGLKEYKAIQRVKEIRHAHLLPIHAFWLLDQNGDPIDDNHLDAYQGREAKFDGHEPSVLVVAMMLADKSLADRLEEYQQANPDQGIPIDELLDHVEDAAKGIDFLNSSRHDLGTGPVALQHCDIKPQNILIVGNSAMVCDFGLARVLSDAHARTTGMAGSPAYMAPECIEARQPSAATDQYSLAITYVELRTGQLPFDSDSYAAILEAHLHGKVDLGRLSLAEQAVIRRAIASGPEDRFPTSREMVRALRRAVEEAAVEESARDENALDESAVDESIVEKIAAESSPIASPATPDLAATLMPDDSNLPTIRAASTRETSAFEQSLVDSHPDKAPLQTAAAPLLMSNQRSPQSPRGERNPSDTTPHGAGRLLAVAIVIMLFGTLAWYAPSIMARFKSEPAASVPRRSTPSPTATAPPAETIPNPATTRSAKPTEKLPIEKAPAEKTRTVELCFLPPDVEVFVDGTLRETSGGTLTITGLLNQEVQIRVSKTGYETLAQQQTLSHWAKQQEPVTLRLTIAGAIALANEQTQAGRHREAVEAFDQALRTLGEDHQKSKRYSQAIASLKEATRLSPKLAPDVKPVLAAAYLGLDIQQADIYRRQGIAAAKAGKTKDAIDRLTESITLDPADDTFAARGFAYNAAGDYDQAIIDLTKAIRLSPNRAIYYTNRAYAHNAKGSFREALVDLKKSLELDGHNPIALSNRGYAHRMLGNHDDAITDYEQSLKLKPQSNDAAKFGLAASYWKRAESHLLNSSHSQAISDYQSAIGHWPKYANTLSPKLAEVYLERGRTFARSIKFDLAVADFDRAIEILPNNAEAYRLRATAYTKRKKTGDSSRAEADFAKVKEIELNRSVAPQ